MGATAQHKTIRPGYKLTEVGVIPVEWFDQPCAEVCVKIQDGTHFSPSLGGNDYLYVTSKNIGFGYLDVSNADRVDTTQHKAIYKRCDVRQGDLLLTKDGANTGNAALNTLEEEFSLLSSVAFLRFDAKRHVAGYFLQQILSNPGQNRIKDAMAGNAITRLTLEKIRKLRFPVAPVPEQHAIAGVLHDVDELIDVLDKLTAKKRDLKRAVMQELLTGKRRLPGFARAKAGFKQTEVGAIPDEWAVKRLGDLFEVTSSKRVFQSEWRTQGVPFYRARELAVLGEFGSVNNELFITQKMYDAFKRAYGVPNVGDMLVTGVGTLGKVYVVTDEREFYFKDGNIIWFKIAGTVAPEFLRQLYLTPLITKQISDGSGGTTVGTYTITGAKKTVIPFPPLPEQTAIAAVLSDMDADIAALEARRIKAQAMKQGMMQQLLTGNIRLI